MAANRQGAGLCLHIKKKSTKTQPNNMLNRMYTSMSLLTNRGDATERYNNDAHNRMKGTPLSVPLLLTHYSSFSPTRSLVSLCTYSNVSNLFKPLGPHPLHAAVLCEALASVWKHANIQSSGIMYLINNQQWLHRYGCWTLTRVYELGLG